MGTYFAFEELEGKIGLVTFDTPGKKVNTLGQPVVEEFEQLLGDLEKKTFAGCSCEAVRRINSLPGRISRN